MNKTKLGVVVAASACLLSGAILLAQNLKQDYQMEFGVGQQEYRVNGTIKTFHDNTENLPLVDKQTNILYMPLRLVIEEMGGGVEWNPKKEAVTIHYKKTNIDLKQDSNYATINGYSIVLKNVPKNFNNCLYVPVDFIADNLGTEIEWQEEQNQIIIRTEAISRPVINFNTMEYEGNHGRYIVDVPVITGLVDEKFEQELNRTFSKQRVEDVRSFVAEQEKLGNDVKYDWKSLGTVTVRTPGIVSIVIENTVYDEENSGEIFVDTFTIDLEQQKILEAKDLFKNKKYLSALEHEINTLIRKNPEAYITKKVDDFTEEDCKQFYIENNSLVIIKQISDTKIDKFSIPFAELKRFLKDSYINLVNYS